MTGALHLEAPSLARVPAYAEALRRGWSANNSRDTSGEELAAIEADPDAFLASVLAQSGTVRLADGAEVPKLPSLRRWLWDGDFCGVISLRWQPGTDALPPYVSGHVGYTVVPWKRRRGHATEALRRLLPEAREVGLMRVEITADPDNEASQRVILSNGGRFIETFADPYAGSASKHRYAIDLA